MDLNHSSPELRTIELFSHPVNAVKFTDFLWKMYDASGVFWNVLSNKS